MPHRNNKTGRNTPQERRYMAFLTGLPCCLTGRTDGVVRAHTGGPAEGKGMGQKASLWTVLPLLNELHLREEQGRAEFWAGALPGENHLAWAERLFDNFEQNNRMEAEFTLSEMAELADRAFLLPILERAA